MALLRRLLASQGDDRADLLGRECRRAPGRSAHPPIAGPPAWPRRRRASGATNGARSSARRRVDARSRVRRFPPRSAGSVGRVQPTSAACHAREPGGSALAHQRGSPRSEYAQRRDIGPRRIERQADNSPCHAERRFNSPSPPNRDAAYFSRTVAIRTHSSGSPMESPFPACGTTSSRGPVGRASPRAAGRRKESRSQGLLRRHVRLRLGQN